MYCPPCITYVVKVLLMFTMEELAASTNSSGIFNDAIWPTSVHTTEPMLCRETIEVQVPIVLDVNSKLLTNKSVVIMETMRRHWCRFDIVVCRLDS